MWFVSSPGESLAAQYLEGEDKSVSIVETPLVSSLGGVPPIDEDPASVATR